MCAVQNFHKFIGFYPYTEIFLLLLRTVIKENMIGNTDMTEKSSADGMAAYESLVNSVGADSTLIHNAVSDIIATDASGQFSASAARFLAALDREGYAPEIDLLLAAVIDKDRGKQYMPDLLPAVWGDDYMLHADELRERDDNFRRIFKRVHPAGII